MIEVLCGMIASGKSTYAAQRAREGAIIINGDAIVTAAHGGQYTLYNAELKPIYKGIEFCLATSAVAMGRDVIVDNARNLSEKARAKWVAIGRSLDVPVICVAFAMFYPAIHAARRAEADGRGLTFEQWRQIAEHHWNDLYTPPRETEGFEKIISVRWKSEVA